MTGYNPIGNKAITQKCLVDISPVLSYPSDLHAFGNTKVCEFLVRAAIIVVNVFILVCFCH